MLTGERPFKGSTAAAVMSSILRKPPEPISARRKDAPTHIQLAIELCLEKDPAERMQSALSLHEQLRLTRREMSSASGSSSSNYDRQLTHTAIGLVPKRPASQPRPECSPDPAAPARRCISGQLRGNRRGGRHQGPIWCRPRTRTPARSRGALVRGFDHRRRLRHRLGFRGLQLLQSPTFSRCCCWWVHGLGPRTTAGREPFGSTPSR